MKKILLVLLPAVLLCSCTKKVVDTSSNDNSANESDPSITSLPPGGNNPLNVTFKGIDTIQDGADLANDAARNVFTGVMNEHVNIMQEFTASKTYFKKIGIPNTPVSLGVGTGSAGGELNITFNYKISKIDVVLQPYYNKYEYNGEKINVDSASEITIGGKAFNLNVTDTTVMPEEVNGTIDFETPITSLKISNDGAKHRVFIHQMTITYIVE